MYSFKVLLTSLLAVGISITSAIIPSQILRQETLANPLTSSFLIAADVGSEVSVSWKGDWYDAKIIATKGNKYKVTYIGYDSSWDEWVGAGRIRWKVGNKVSVSWKGDWYDAKIIAIREDKYKVTYIGYDSSWDEWVGAGRIR